MMTYEDWLRWHERANRIAGLAFYGGNAVLMVNFVAGAISAAEAMAGIAAVFFAGIAGLEWAKRRTVRGLEGTFADRRRAIAAEAEAYPGGQR